MENQGTSIKVSKSQLVTMVMFSGNVSVATTGDMLAKYLFYYHFSRKLRSFPNVSKWSTWLTCNFKLKMKGKRKCPFLHVHITREYKNIPQTNF